MGKLGIPVVAVNIAKKMALEKGACFFSNQLW
jgi:hypothetical protein